MPEQKVESGRIATGAVTGDKIGITAVGANNIANGAIDVLQAKYIIFATGGFSQIYKTNSSSHLYTGCGHRILFQKGICLFYWAWRL